MQETGEFDATPVASARTGGTSPTGRELAAYNDCASSRLL